MMGLAINPKDTNTFASACLDRTVKVWNLSSNHPNYSIEAHEAKGVNFVDYYPHSDKPYLLTTSDDKTCKVWDYQTRALVATLEGHTSNVSFAVYHPELPIIITGSEDGQVKIWHANTYRLLQSLSYGLERAWCVGYQRGRQGIAMGFDDGAVVVSMGREEPAVSMDSSGKIVWARTGQNEVVSMVVKGGDANLKDGAPLSLPTKELGSCEIYPQTLSHSPNGRFVSGEFPPYRIFGRYCFRLARLRAKIQIFPISYSTGVLGNTDLDPKIYPKALLLTMWDVQSAAMESLSSIRRLLGGIRLLEQLWILLGAGKKTTMTMRSESPQQA